MREIRWLTSMILLGLFHPVQAQLLHDAKTRTAVVRADVPYIVEFQHDGQFHYTPPTDRRIRHAADTEQLRGYALYVDGKLEIYRDSQYATLYQSIDHTESLYTFQFEMKALKPGNHTITVGVRDGKTERIHEVIQVVALDLNKNTQELITP